MTKSSDHNSIAVISNTSWYLYNFRLRMMLALRDAGYQVIAMAPLDSYSEKIMDQGIHFVPIKLNRRGTNPLVESVFLVKLFRCIQRVYPCAILSFTPKINIYASLCARILRIPIIVNVSGLGFVFTHVSILTRIVNLMYRIAFQHASKIFFQNNNDLECFLEQHIVDRARCERLPGSGVNTDHFVPVAPESKHGQFIFLLVARLLWDKGIGEYVQAARHIKEHYPDTRFEILGPIDEGNPAAITREQIFMWHSEGVVFYHGASDDVREVMATVNCVVLPSYYREGCPRTLLEAASMALPIVTTDTNGCRDTIVDGVTGYLCRPRDAEDLEEKMLKMRLQPEERLHEMGLHGRRKMIEEFDESIVINRYKDIIYNLHSSS